MFGAFSPGPPGTHTSSSVAFRKAHIDDLVNVTIPGQQFQQSFTSVSSSGNRFAIVWKNAALSPGLIYTRFYDDDFTPLTGEVQIPVAVAGNNQAYATVATAANGNYLIFWRESGDRHFYWREYSTAGVAVAGPFQADSGDTDNHGHGTLAVSPADGTIIASWMGARPPATTRGYQFRRFTAAGVALDAGSVAVAPAGGWTSNISSVQSPAGIDSSGDFVLAVEGNATGAEAGIWLFRMNADGTAKAPGFNASSGAGRDAGLAMRSNGDFLLVWDGGTLGKAQEYDSAGATVGAELDILLSAWSGGSPDSPNAIALAEGGYAVVVTDLLSGSDSQRAFRILRNGEGGSVFTQRIADMEGNPKLSQRSDGSIVNIWDNRIDPVTGDPGEDVYFTVFTLG